MYVRVYERVGLDECACDDVRDVCMCVVGA